MNSKEIRVFKFRNGNSNDLDALFENYVWFARLSDLNDPYEGYASFSKEDIDDDFREIFLASVYSKKPHEGVNPKEEAKIYRQEYEGDTGTTFSEYVDSKAEELIKSMYEEHKNDYKIFSLSLAREDNEFPAPLNNMLMWSHYANGFKGFCIEFNYEKLKNSIETKQKTKLGTSKIEYATEGKLPIIKMKTFMQSAMDGSTDCSHEILDAFTKKERSWIYENEVRFLSDQSGKLYYSSDCINAIYFAEKAPRWMKNNILSYAKQSESEIKVYLVQLHSSEYKFGYSRVNA